MNEWKLTDEHSGKTRHFDSKAKAEDAKADMQSICEGPLVIDHVGDETPNDAYGPGTPCSVCGESIESDAPSNAECCATHRPEGDAPMPEVDELKSAEVVEPAELSENPIQFLQEVNSDFVNRIKGTPAISKQGFRFIQREFEISTESEVVEWSSDPLGCVVWAKAELPGGYSAEAHGEGWQFESKVDDNEFVRYADTRAKNRAISDLTSAGALAVSELQE